VKETNLLQTIQRQASSGALANPKDRAELVAKIFQLQDEVGKLPQETGGLQHHFSEGLYGRELSLTKGTLIVGKIHKYKNLNIILKGRVTFFSIDGAYEVTAPKVFVASPGVKRVIYAHEDSIWMNVHATKETDINKIEEEVIAKTFDSVEGISEEELKIIKEALVCHG